jgi:predicted extracellular nuclease
MFNACRPLRMGDTVSALTGVVDDSFSDYRVIPTQNPTFVATNPRTSANLTLGNLKVASLNELNFCNTIILVPVFVDQQVMLIVVVLMIVVLTAMV